MAQDLLVLNKVRIRGLGSVIDSVWFDIGRKLTIFSLPPSFDRIGFLKALQTINPPYPLLEGEPFKDYPRIVRQGKYQKRVRPERRTIAFTIFTAQPQLVIDFGKITPHLFETDRIEVGRRLDYSRWINFVEIASTTRWSEIREGVKKASGRLRRQGHEDGEEIISDLKPSDRIKNEKREELERFISRVLQNEEDGERKRELNEILFAVRRQKHFDEAKEKVGLYLPFFHMIQNDMRTVNGGGRGKSIADCFLQEAETIRGLYEDYDGNQPILLFDQPDENLSNQEKKHLFEVVKTVSETCQCFYLPGEEESFSEGGGIKIVQLKDMVL